jgi:uncharacterized protein YggT (Ycf19 family)
LSIARLICLLLQAYTLAVLSVYSFLYLITEPVLGPIRRVLPPLGAGGMGLDLSPIIVFFGITILLRAIC